MAKKIMEGGIADTYLPKKKIILKPTPRTGQMVDDPNHKMYFMMEDAIIEWKLPLNEKNGQLHDPFASPEERKFFEEVLDTDLNIFNKTNNFWWNFKVQVTKTPNLIEDGIVFDLSDPMQNLKVKILKLQEDIAPNWSQRKRRPKYKWVLVDETQEFVDKSSEADKLADAYAHFATIKNSESKMIEFLKIFGSTNNLGKRVPKDAKIEFLKAEVSGIIENRLDAYLEIVRSEDYNFRVMLEKAVEVGAIEQRHNTYVLPGGDSINPIDATYKGTISELRAWSNPAHDGYEKYSTIKARIDAAR